MQNHHQQDLAVKKGEVTFRQKLASQQLKDGKIVFPDAHNYEEMLDSMRQRAEATRHSMERLAGRGTQLTPFIELGAERCHRSLVLVNEFQAEGIAADISLDMLQLGKFVAEGLGYKKLPLRICCDANNLPFRNDALRFAFCYETLHHFPDPGPILNEMVRVLGDQSVLYFDEEPVKGSLYRFTRLYQRHGHRLSSIENMLNRLGILPLISKAGGVEIEHGILEEEFDLKTWQKALAPFPDAEVTVNKMLNLHLENFRPGISKTIASILGGCIEVYCNIKKKHPGSVLSTNLLEMLRCPSCTGDSNLIQREKGGRGLTCDRCGSFYPEVDGVLILLENTLGRNLYPEFFQ